MFDLLARPELVQGSSDEKAVVAALMESQFSKCRSSVTLPPNRNECCSAGIVQTIVELMDSDREDVEFEVVVIVLELKSKAVKRRPQLFSLDELETSIETEFDRDTENDQTGA
ncbi:hypothetical protein HPB50_028205 [Hyalomma asiaticum]|nr:hypothetical protein HPB50_028205 [Hyalomma asiaticum]